MTPRRHGACPGLALEGLMDWCGPALPPLCLAACLPRRAPQAVDVPCRERAHSGLSHVSLEWGWGVVTGTVDENFPCLFFLSCSELL